MALNPVSKPRTSNPFSSGKANRYLHQQQPHSEVGKPGSDRGRSAVRTKSLNVHMKKQREYPG